MQGSSATRRAVSSVGSSTQEGVLQREKREYGDFALHFFFVSCAILSYHVQKRVCSAVELSALAFAHACIRALTFDLFIFYFCSFLISALLIFMFFSFLFSLLLF